MKTLHIQLEDDQHQKLKMHALKADMTMKEWLVHFIDNAPYHLLATKEISSNVRPNLSAIQKPSPTLSEKNKSVGKPNFCKLHQMDKEYCGLMKH